MSNFSNGWTSPVQNKSLEDMALAVLCRIRAAYDVGGNTIGVEFTDSPVHNMVWEEFKLMVDQYGVDKVFSFNLYTFAEEMTARCNERIDEDPGDFLRTGLYGSNGMDGLLGKLCDGNLPSLDTDVALDRIQKLVKAKGPQRQAVQLLADTILTNDEQNTTFAIEKFNQSMAYTQSYAQSFDTFPLEVFQEGNGLDTQSTGIPFLDAYMGGGFVPGEVYATLGSTGAGKTTAAVQTACELAKIEYFKRLADSTYKPKYPVIVHYEANTVEIAARMLSNLADIPLSTVRRYMGQKFDTSLLSRSSEPSTYQKYEIDYQAGTGGVRSKAGLIPGELERFNRALAIMRYVITVDMSNNNRVKRPNQFPGNGYVDEIAQALRMARGAFRERLKDNVSIVFVDYVGKCVQQYMDAKGRKKEEETGLISNFGMHSKNKIASPFNCAVWLLHQLNKEGNEMPVGVDVHHTYAKGSGTFAEHLDFCFTLGKLDKKSKCLKFNMAKHRRVEAMESMLLHLRGEFCMFDSADGYAVFRESTRSIELVEDSFDPFVQTIAFPSMGKKHSGNKPGIDLGDLSDPNAGNLG